VVGSLQRHASYWEKFATRQVLLWVQEGYSAPPISSIPLYLKRRPLNKIFEPDQVAWTSQEISRLVSTGALELMGEGEFCPPGIRTACYIRLAPKKGPKLWRLVVNQRPLKQFLGTKSVKYEDLTVISSLIQKGSWGSSFDLRAGYHQVLIQKDFRKFLGIYWEGKWYRFAVLPFGLSHSPWVFCTIMQQIVNFWRGLGIQVTFYIDDFLLLAPTEEECWKIRLWIEESMKAAGLIIEPSKGQRVPTQRIPHLGMIVNLKDGTFEIPMEKISELQDLILNSTKKEQLTGRELASLAGKIVSLARAFSPARLYVRDLYSYMTKQKKELGITDWDTQFPLKPQFMEQLLWISEALVLFNGKTFWRKATLMIIQTDASLLGWGVWTCEEQTGGQWTQEEQRYHINILELMAVEKAFRALGNQLRGQVVQLQMDNQVALSYLKNFKGGKKDLLNQIAGKIWFLCVELDLEIAETIWIPSESNKADWESRFLETQAWTVQDWVFQKAQKKWGNLTFDRFASHRNSKVARFNSEAWCPQTCAVNSLTQDWTTEKNWAVPPTDLIWLVLRLLKEQKASTVMVIPIWTNKPWWFLLEEMLVDKFNLPNSENWAQGKEDDLPFKKGWRWMAVLVDGKKCRSSWDLQEQGQQMQSIKQPGSS